jgi:hypothetical protein
VVDPKRMVLVSLTQEYSMALSPQESYHTSLDHICLHPLHLSLTPTLGPSRVVIACPMTSTGPLSSGHP